MENKQVMKNYMDEEKTSNFPPEWDKLFLQTKFLVVGSSLGHLSMKKFFRSDLPSWV